MVQEVSFKDKVHFLNVEVMFVEVGNLGFSLDWMFLFNEVDIQVTTSDSDKLL